MGLDLIPQAKAKPGHEAEWRRLIEADFSGRTLPDSEVKRFQDITIPPYAALGAPRVGFDSIASDWIVKARGLTAKSEIEACLAEFHGYYAIVFVGPPGVPKYSNGGLYQGIDETSFRGTFLKDCGILIGDALVERAWSSMWPEEAAAYGRALLERAGENGAGGTALPRAKSSFWARLRKPNKTESAGNPIDIVLAAGEWYVFWGTRGHPIKAWF